jgi:ATP-dependent Clp protease ATP-binding subunit ClpC
VTKDKDAAVRGQDFEKAGQLRDREMELKAKIQAIIAGAKETSKAEAESVEGGGPMVGHNRQQQQAAVVAMGACWQGISSAGVSNASCHAFCCRTGVWPCPPLVEPVHVLRSGGTTAPC